MNPTSVHGRTPDDIHRLAVEALRADRWRTAAGLDERYCAAWAAIAELLCATTQPPTHAELLAAGTRASHDTGRATQQAHGRDRDGTTRPRYNAYWDAAAAHTPSPEDVVLERHALAQVRAALTARDRQTLNVYTATGDQQTAADHLGLSRTGFSKRLRQARQAALALWYDHETPPPPARHRRAGARNGMWKGRPRLTEQQVDALRARHHAGGVTYADLAAETGADADRLSELIRGVRDAAPDRAA